MSSSATFFIQECPTCGRKVRVCVEYLGMEIQCRHCHAVFVAVDYVGRYLDVLLRANCGREGRCDQDDSDEVVFAVSAYSHAIALSVLSVKRMAE